jgi:hypothetical protein
VEQRVPVQQLLLVERLAPVEQRARVEQPVPVEQPVSVEQLAPVEQRARVEQLVARTQQRVAELVADSCIRLPKPPDLWLLVKSPAQLFAQQGTCDPTDHG